MHTATLVALATTGVPAVQATGSEFKIIGIAATLLVQPNVSQVEIQWDHRAAQLITR